DIYLKAENIFTLYYVLILKSIYANNPKILTNFLNLAIVLERNERVNNKIEGFSKEYTYNISLAKLLIIAILKSIELGHHSCTGFLIKVAVNHQDSILLNQTLSSYYKEIKEQVVNDTLDIDASIQSSDVNRNLLDEINFKVHLSSRSWDYCYYKMAHLLNKKHC